MPCRGDNLLFDAGGRLKLIDYNCARVASGATLSAGTANGATLYRAPELAVQQLAVPHLAIPQLTEPGYCEEARGQYTNTPAADMWSAGLIIYEMLTGSLAYCPPRAAGVLNRDPVVDWATRVAEGRSPEEVAPLPDDAPAYLVRIMQACLKARPEDRITAAAAHALLCPIRLQDGTCVVVRVVRMDARGNQLEENHATLVSYFGSLSQR